MGYTNANGIYIPQHGESGWSDEMNANLDYLRKPISVQYPDCNAGFYRYQAGGIETLQNGVQYAANPGTPDRLHDPSGLFPADSYVSTWHGITIPRYGHAILPPGVWLCIAHVVWQSQTGFRIGYWEMAEDASADPFAYVVWGGSFILSTFDVNNAQSTVVQSSLVTVPQGETRRIAFLVRHAVGSPQLVYEYTAFLNKIGA